MCYDIVVCEDCGEWIDELDTVNHVCHPNMSAKPVAEEEHIAEVSIPLVKKMRERKASRS